MRTSAVIAIAILIAGTIPALIQQKRLNAAQHNQATPTTEGRLPPSRGNLEVPDQPDARPARSENSRETRLAITKTLAFARRMADLSRTGGEPDATFHREGSEMVSHLMDLSPSQLREVITALRENEGLDPATRGKLIAFSMTMFAKDNPQAALSLYTESTDLIDRSLIGSYAVSTALKAWGASNPYAALEWIRHNQAANSDLPADEAIRHVIAGAAATDPATGFRLMAQLPPEDSEEAIAAIVMATNQNPEQRTALLNALRGHLDTISDPRQREEISSQALEMLARNSNEEGFDATERWITGASLTPEEKERYVQGLDYFTTRGDTGRWVEWMSANIPPDKLPENVRNMVSDWTQQDYVAAGTWLSATPEGPAKTAAIEAYCEAVAEYEPQTAAQWAMTLPAGSARTSTLRAIYQNWPPADPEGAAAFAREHGLE